MTGGLRVNDRGFRRGGFAFERYFGPPVTTAAVPARPLRQLSVWTCPSTTSRCSATSSCRSARWDLLTRSWLLTATVRRYRACSYPTYHRRHHACSYPTTTQPRLHAATHACSYPTYDALLGPTIESSDANSYTKSHDTATDACTSAFLLLGPTSRVTCIC